MLERLVRCVCIRLVGEDIPQEGAQMRIQRFLISDRAQQIDRGLVSGSKCDRSASFARGINQCSCVELAGRSFRGQNQVLVFERLEAGQGLGSWPGRG